jgi:predicted Zn finger-like uncharacterized protein
MLLATRCPFCETVFRVQPAQLAARRGLVRCGHCQEAFDATGSLFEVPEGGDFASAVPVAADLAATLTTSAQAEEAVQAAAPEATVAPQAAPQPAARRPAPSPNFSNRGWDPWAPRADSHIDPNLQYSADHLPRAGIAPAATPHIVGREEPVLAPAPAEPVPELLEPTPSATTWRRVEPDLAEPSFSANEASAARARDPEPVLSPGAAAAAASPASTSAPGFSALSPGEGPEPFAVTREAPARAPSRTGWRVLGALVSIVLLAMLGALLAWWLRETVMVYWPGSQPLYAQACEQIGCRVLPPRDIDGLQVEPSDLRQVDDPHHLELKVPLRNHFNVALAYPAIELTLLDRQNNVVVRRVLWPQDYVSPGTRVEAGLPARTTQTMIVRLDTGNVVASNFRIEIFYP